MTTISISSHHLKALREHLFLGKHEQAAFGFASWEPNKPGGLFRIQTLEFIRPNEFAFQSSYHLELGSEAQARIIKLAFDRRASLVEFHSHRTNWPAQFSHSDFSGFEEFVPHVRWRLSGRPYAAVVFHESSFDGLVWVDEQRVQLDGIESDGLQPQLATGLSLRAAEEPYDR